MMAESTATELESKLFSLIQRPRRIHALPEVRLPRSLAPMAQSELFADPHPTRRRLLELGAGWGEFCIDFLLAEPEWQYVAFEIKTERITALSRGVRQHALGGVTILPVNFEWFLSEILPPHSFDRIVVNFPDPWPKRRHWKHRLVQAHFPAKAAALLRPGGEIHLATDYSPYARRMLSHFRRDHHFEPIDAPCGYLRTRPAGVPSTRFEQMQSAAGYRPFYLRWRLKDGH